MLPPDRAFGQERLFLKALTFLDIDDCRECDVLSKRRSKPIVDDLGHVGECPFLAEPCRSSGDRTVLARSGSTPTYLLPPFGPTLLPVRSGSEPA